MELAEKFWNVKLFGSNQTGHHIEGIAVRLHRKHVAFFAFHFQKSVIVYADDRRRLRRIIGSHDANFHRTVNRNKKVTKRPKLKRIVRK